MALDGLVEGERQSVVHQLWPRAHAPQRRSSHHVPGARAAVLDDPVTRPDVVQQEVTERAYSLVAESRRNYERALVDHRARRGGDYRWSVTDVTPYCIEQISASSDGGGDRTAPRRPGGSHEIGERLHVIAVVLRVRRVPVEGRNRSTQGVVLNPSTVAVKGIGDPHFVQVSVTRERLQTGVLVLPTEAGAAQLVTSLDHRNLDE